MPEVDDYSSLLMELMKVWLLIELNHRVSKTAANAFWAAAHKYFYRLMIAKNQQRIKKNVPQFAHLRRKLYATLPKIQLEIGYVHKETGVHTTVRTEVTPKAQYPPNIFQKVYEIAYVKVSKFPSMNYLSIYHSFLCCYLCL